MTSTIEDQMQDAEDYLSAYEMARTTYANLVREEMGMEAVRAIIKSHAILRLMDTPNLASREGKPHSATSADAVVETDADYAAHLLNLRNVVHAKLRAETEAKANFLRAKMALTMVKANAGVI